MQRLRLLAITFLALLGLALPGSRHVPPMDTIKIGYIDPFSGAFAAGGDASLKMFQFILDYINAKGGALGKKFELVTFDDKLQPAEALIALKSITDQNLPFVMSCVGSNVGSALIDAVNKHNARNPDNRILQTQLRPARDRADQRAVQLLAFPLRRQRGDARGGADQVAAAVGEVGLSAEPGLSVRPVDRARYQALPRAVPPGHQDRRRRVHSADADQGFFARISPRSRRRVRSRC